jgi:hypothetical protein
MNLTAINFDSAINLYYNLNRNLAGKLEGEENRQLKEDLMEETTSFIIGHLSHAEVLDSKYHTYKLVFDPEVGVSNLIIESSTYSVYTDQSMNDNTQKMITLCYASKISTFLIQKREEIKTSELIEMSDNVIVFKRK